MISEDAEGAPLHHVPEVANGGDTGEQLPVEGRVFHLCRIQLLREEAEWVPS